MAKLNDPLDPADAFHALVATVDYPMFVVTASSGGERSGCLVGFATQASIDPPRLIVLLSKANHTYRVAMEASQLAVHFLHERNRDLAEVFGEETGDQVDKFSEVPWEQVEGVEPPVLPGTRGWVVGRVLDRLDAGDHVAHLIDVAVARVDGHGASLTFQEVRDLPPGHPV